MSGLKAARACYGGSRAMMARRDEESLLPHAHLVESDTAVKTVCHVSHGATRARYSVLCVASNSCGEERMRHGQGVGFVQVGFFCVSARRGDAAYGLLM